MHRVFEESDVYPDSVFIEFNEPKDGITAVPAKVLVDGSSRIRNAVKQSAFPLFVNNGRFRQIETPKALPPYFLRARQLETHTSFGSPSTMTENRQNEDFAFLAMTWHFRESLSGDGTTT